MDRIEEQLPAILHDAADCIEASPRLGAMVFAGLGVSAPGQGRGLVGRGGNPGRDRDGRYRALGTGRLPRIPSRVAVFAAAAVAVLTTAAVLIQPWNGGTTTVHTLGGASLEALPASKLPTSGAWTALPAAPVAARDQYLEVWTGSVMLAWGGYGASGAALGDGAAYNPATRAWRALPQGPLAAIDGPVGAWDGTEMLVFGNPNPDGPEPATSPGAAYNPATNAWRNLAPFPLGALADSGSYAVWTGSRLLVWGFFGQGAGTHGTADFRAASFDPATNKWTPTSAAPVEAPIFGDAFWTGSQLLVYGLVGTSGTSVGNMQLVSYTPASNSWTVLSPGPLPGSRSSVAAAWDGTELIVGGGGGQAGSLQDDAAAFNPGINTWRVLPDAPIGFDGSGRYSDMWTGSQMLVVEDGDPAGRPLLFDPATQLWSLGAPAPVAGRTDAPAVWDGSEALVWGGGVPEAFPAAASPALAANPSPAPTPTPADPASAPQAGDTSGATSCCKPLAQGYAFRP